MQCVTVLDQAIVDGNHASQANNLLLMMTQKRPGSEPSYPPWKQKPPRCEYLCQYETTPPPPWREPAPLCNAAQLTKKHTCGKRPLSSAAQPATKRGDSCVSRPGHRASRAGSKYPKCDDRASQSEEPGTVIKKLLTSVAYLKLPAFSRKHCAEDAAKRSAIDVVRKAKQAGADIINIVFEKEQDMDLMEKDLEAEMQATVKHPGFFHCRLAQLLTLFSADCGQVVQKDLSGSEGGMPAICITLNGPRENSGAMIIINAASAQLAQPMRERCTGGPCNVFHPWVYSDRGRILFGARRKRG